MKRKFFALLISVFVLTSITNHSIAQAPTNGVIPVPVSQKYGSGAFVLTASTTIGVPPKQPEVTAIATYLSDKIRPATGYSLKTVPSSDGSIQLVIKSKADPLLGNEGYTFKSTPSKLTIEANAAPGLFYGVQTLLQLLPPAIESATLQSASWKIPEADITDFPRFAWRGIMLDVSRHFFPKEYVKAYIDRMARFKLNRFHWHLTDDEGWRIQIKSLPKLTDVGAWRVPRTGTFGENAPAKPGEPATYGGFYTQDDIKEVIEYARQRYVQIMPEIEMPGHSMAAVASYPELSVTNDTSVRVNPGSKFATWGNGTFQMHVDNTLDPTDEKTYQFLDKVLTEVASVFPFEYIHIGGDECYKGFWERDPGVQAFMKKNNIANGVGLQAYMVKRVSKIIASKKKKLIGWDEILEGGGMASGDAVMAWRGVKGGVEASHKKHTVVMSPAIDWYLDMMQADASTEPLVYGTTRLNNVYAFDILPEGIDSTYVIGGQGNLWTEQIPTTAQVEYMTYPRAFAIAENLWSPRQSKDWKSFTNRVEQQFVRFDAARINYARSMYDPIIKVTKGVDGLEVELKTEIEGLDLYYTLDNSVPNQFHPKYSGKIVFPPDVDNFRVVSYRNGVPVGMSILLTREQLEKRISN